jgi:hypothetical protein
MIAQTFGIALRRLHVSSRIYHELETKLVRLLPSNNIEFRVEVLGGMEIM